MKTIEEAIALAAGKYSENLTEARAKAPPPAQGATNAAGMRKLKKDLEAAVKAINIMNETDPQDLLKDKVANQLYSECYEIMQVIATWDWYAYEQN